MFETITTSHCTTRHHCPGIERSLGHKIPFLGYCPKTCRIDQKGYKLVFQVELPNGTKGLVFGDTVEEVVATIDQQVTKS